MAPSTKEQASSAATAKVSDESSRSAQRGADPASSLPPQRAGITPETFQWGFVGFTVVQCFMFVFFPQSMDMVSQGVLEGPPYYAALKALGIKEVGLMAIYVAALLSRDRRFLAVTIVGRLCTIVWVLYLILVRGAPNALVGGIPQDVISASVMVYLLVRDAQGLPPRRLVASLADAPVRAAVFLSGCAELYSGAIMAFTDDCSQQTVIRQIYGAPLCAGVRSVGFMTVLVGGYQMALGVNRAPTEVYAAVAFHHAWFYYVTRRLTSDYLYAEDFHRVAFFSVAMGTLFAKALDARWRRAEKRKSS